jgi:hypothetical protein
MRNYYGLRLARVPAILFFLCFANILATTFGNAREVVSLTDEFGVLRDFAQITIKGPDLKSARIFIDTDRFVVRSLSDEESAKLRHIAIDGLGSHLTLVKSKDEANYLIQIRMGQDTNYAIRNPKRQPSRGYVMISICKLPIQKVSEDCENLQYDYFRAYEAKDIFSRVMHMWVEAKLETSTSAFGEDRAVVTLVACSDGAGWGWLCASRRAR